MTIGGGEATAIAGGATSLAGSAANSVGRALKAGSATPDQDRAIEAPQASLAWQPAPQARWEQLGLAKRRMRLKDLAWRRQKIKDRKNASHQKPPAECTTQPHEKSLSGT